MTTLFSRHLDAGRGRFAVAGGESSIVPNEG